MKIENILFGKTADRITRIGVAVIGLYVAYIAIKMIFQ